MKNFDITEDMGRINHIFCDKTGTLTKNKLEFRGFATNHNYLQIDMTREQGKQEFIEAVRASSVKEGPMQMLMRCLCLCHDINMIKLEGHDKEVLSGASLDEIAIVEMIQEIGSVVMTAKYRGRVLLRVCGEEEKYEIVKVVEFNSERKRMTVVVRREQDKKLFAFIKGADIAIIPRLVDMARDKQTIDQMDEFARRGLRTLAVAMKEDFGWEPTDEEVEAMSEEKFEDLFEKNIKMIGTTALEDLLQDRVKECI
jgi:magnesium-transporting ATPase (P-type)